MREGKSNGYLPTGLWYAMVEIAMANGIAIKEVEVTLIREMLQRDFGFKCTHPEEKVRVRSKDSIYCTYCWTRLNREQRSKLDPMNRSKVLPNIYTPRPTFFDKREQEEKELATEPDSSLLPDPRGGE